MTVDEALEHADKRLDSDCRTLAAEVRRLRAMPGDLFGEIFERLCPAGWDKDDWVHECFSIMQEIAPESAAHDNSLLDEAAERGVAWLIEQTSHIDPALAATNSGRWLIKLREKQTAELRAAIKGAAHE